MSSLFDQAEEEIKSITEIISLLSNDSENLYPGGASEEEISELEQELGTTLPLGYVEFLKKFGGGSFRHLQLYSIASEDENFPDFMEQVFTHTGNIHLVQQGDLLPFADDYEGNIFCFDLQHSRDGEFQVVRWNHDFKHEDEPILIAQNFAEFLQKIEISQI